jgi:hypothetical protein
MSPSGLLRLWCILRALRDLRAYPRVAAQVGRAVSLMRLGPLTVEMREFVRASLEDEGEWRGRWEPPESLARGTLSQGFSRNLGDLPSPPVPSRHGAPDSNGPGPGWVNALARGTNGHSAERYRAVEGDRRRPGRAGRSLTTS